MGCFMREMAPAVSRVPYMTTPGNHEGLWNFTGYKSRFPHPDTAYGGPSDAMYYTFSVGPVRFVMLDSETEWNGPRMDPVQVAWAKRVMTEANAQGQFIWVGFHRPMYCSVGKDWPNMNSACGDGQAGFLRAQLEEALMDHEVAAVHYGHVHMYERTVPVYNGTIVGSYENATAPAHWMNGGPGCEEGFTHYDADQVWQPWSAKHIDTTSFLHWDISEQASGSQQMRRFFCNATLTSSKTGDSFDNVILTKNVNIKA